ncbi:hypothetical protein M422DRAFT_55406 [Sphaerobolus stellatus SS14]|uniref:Zn(2)-C6 fungal-type domain-containing protein n=1 Tax=Sphaerobolus stellatus (strain SS14) TaxID=990650 RepID=A0A0C9UC18_SPHS4|nr:hypothetical protein M422DRAFT_55406 [Sphaerobolus stellatus SS14]
MPAARTKKEDSRISPSSGDDAKDAKDADGKVKRKRQSQSCDACRARKVRCARENADDPQGSCKHCVSLGIPCTYDYQPKKRGPPNLYLRRLQEAAAAAAHQTDSPMNGNDNLSITVPQSNGTPQSNPSSLPNGIITSPTLSSSYLDHSVASPLSAHAHPFAHAPPPPPTVPSVTLPPSRYPIAADTYHLHQPSPINTNLSSYMPDPRVTDPLGSMSPSNRPSSASTISSNHSTTSFSRTIGSPLSTDIQPFSPSFQWGSQQNKQATTNPVPLLPPLDYFVRPHRLEDVAPRETILLIISLFFDFVYPLTPCIHKPSFMADLQSRREERDPLFFALVMSTVASTCVQVPRSYLPMERREVRKLGQTCHEASRHISVATYDPPTSMHVVIRYLYVSISFDCDARADRAINSDTVYHFCEGHDATSHASFGEAAHIAVTLHMHEEASYEGLDPIECEVRRRVFWLLFGADKSMSILLGRPICLRDEDCTLHFPKEVDDE